MEGVPQSDLSLYSLQVFTNTLGGGMSSRLFQEVREKRGLVYAIHSFAHSYRDGGLFGIYAGTGEEERTTNTFRPTGGVMSEISHILMTTTPSQIGS